MRTVPDAQGHSELSELHGKHMQRLVLREPTLQGGDCNHGEHHVSGSCYNNSVILGSVGKKTSIVMNFICHFLLTFFFFFKPWTCFVLFCNESLKQKSSCENKIQMLTVVISR